MDDPTLMLGYVGRLSVEKNVALLAKIERELLALGITDFRFFIVGHGSEDLDALPAERAPAAGGPLGKGDRPEGHPDADPEGRAGAPRAIRIVG